MFSAKAHERLAELIYEILEEEKKENNQNIIYD